MSFRFRCVSGASSVQSLLLLQPSREAPHLQIWAKAHMQPTRVDRERGPSGLCSDPSLGIGRAWTEPWLCEAGLKGSCKRPEGSE